MPSLLLDCSVLVEGTDFDCSIPSAFAMVVVLFIHVFKGKEVSFVVPENAVVTGDSEQVLVKETKVLTMFN